MKSLYAFVLLAIAAPVSASEAGEAAAPAPPIEITRIISPGPVQIATPPMPLKPMHLYFVNDDYPSLALSARQQGRVDLLLTISTIGRVSGCAITRSSGSPFLDNASCSVMTRRARFSPARDGDGNPAVGTISHAVSWRLPRR